MEIETGPDAGQVESLLTKGLDGKTRRFTSKIYILASGIENARLLLLSNRVRPNGLGNDHDNVGRYFMAHTTLRTGRALLSIPDETIKLYKTRGFENFRSEDLPMIDVLQPTAKAQEEERMLNCVVFFEQSYEGERSPGFAAIRRILRHLSYGRMPDKLGEELATIVGDLDTGRQGALCPRLPRQQLSPVADTLFLGTGPQPGQQDHAWGRARRARPEQDGAGLAPGRLGQAHDPLHPGIAGPPVRRTGAGPHPGGVRGPVRSVASGVDSSAHYMGTTRMHKDPRHGVVDEHCRVHGIENLYVAGGSVFPTTGATMVTVNIVAMAVRLADHLRNKLA